MGNANLSGGLYAARPATPTVGMIYAATDRLLLSVCITAGSWLELVGGPRTGTLAARGSAATYIGSLYRVTSGDGSGDLYASDGTDWALVSVSRRLPRDAAVLHRWTLDEGTGVSFADTGTANDTLTLAGSGVVVDGAGTVGCGLRFTGTSALASTSASPATPNPGAFSVALTLRMDIQTGDQYPMVKLVTPGAWTPLEAAFAVKLEWGTLFIGHNVGGWQAHACTRVQLATGALYRVLAVFDGSVWRVYLNGVLIDTWAAVGTVNWGTGEWVLGGIPTVSVPFHGLVDEVDVHDAVLSPAQAVEDYLRAFNLWSVGGDSGGGGGGGGSGNTHGSGALPLPASPVAGDTYAVISGAGRGRRYVCEVAGAWRLDAPAGTCALAIPDGTGDVLCIVPDSETHGSTTFTDLSSGAHTITATGAYHSTLRRALGASCMKLAATAIDGSAGYASAPQNDVFAFDTGDFSVQVVATVLTAPGTAQRLIAQGRVEDGVGRWCFGFAADGRLNFAYHNGSTVIDIYSASALVALCLGRPVLIEASRASGTLRLFVDGVVVATATVTTAIGVPVSGAPSAADAIILGARSPASPTEYLIGGEIHVARMTATALHTSAYDPTA